MAEENFRVVIKGIRENGVGEVTAAKLAALFKVPQEKAEKILSLDYFVVKKSVTLESAKKYAAALEKCGCVCILEREIVISPLTQDAPVDTRPSRATTQTLPTPQANVSVKDSAQSSQLGLRKITILSLGVIGIVAAASGGYFFYQQHQIAEEYKASQKLLQVLRESKPSTFTALAEETKYPPAKPETVDWQNISVQGEPAKLILEALRKKDDEALGKYKDEYFCLGCDGQIEPELSVEEARQEIWKSVENQPAIALEIGDFARRINDFRTSSVWYRIAGNRGSKSAIEKLEAITTSEKDVESITDLALFFSGEFDTVKDFAKTSLYYGSAVRLGAVSNNLSSPIGRLQKIALSNGPKIAASASQYLLKGTKDSSLGNPTDLANACGDASLDVIDPINRGRGQYRDEPGNNALESCRHAIKVNPENPDLWYQLGYAAQRSDDAVGAKIAYARASELGSAIGIARFWWADFPTDGDRAVKMLEAEVKGGNAWGNYFLGKVYDGSFKEARNLEKAKVHYGLAARAGIGAANGPLGDLYFAQGKNRDGMAAWKSASSFLPKIMLDIARKYEEGLEGKPDKSEAITWYIKAEQLDVKGAKEARMKLEGQAAAMTAASHQSKPSETATSDLDRNLVVGEWNCRSMVSGKNLQSFFLFKSDGLVTYLIPNSLQMVGYDFAIQNHRGNATFTEFTRNNRKTTASVAATFEFSAAGSGKLDFQMKLNNEEQVDQSFSCVTLIQSSKPQNIPQSRPTPQIASGDRVAAYANNLAAQLERGSHPACAAFASNIRMLGNSGAPESVRMRQVDSMIDKVPSICLR